MFTNRSRDVNIGLTCYSVTCGVVDFKERRRTPGTGHHRIGPPVPHSCSIRYDTLRVFRAARPTVAQL